MFDCTEIKIRGRTVTDLVALVANGAGLNMSADD
jgi:hypothetical protein